MGQSAMGGGDYGGGGSGYRGGGYQPWRGPSGDPSGWGGGGAGGAPYDPSSGQEGTSRGRYPAGDPSGWGGGGAGGAPQGYDGQREYQRTPYGTGGTGSGSATGYGGGGQGQYIGGGGWAGEPADWRPGSSIGYSQPGQQTGNPYNWGGGNYPGSQGRQRAGWDQQPGGWSGGGGFGYRGAGYGQMGPGGIDPYGNPQNQGSGNYDWTLQNGGWGPASWQGGGGGWGGRGGGWSPPDRWTNRPGGVDPQAPPPAPTADELMRKAHAAADAYKAGTGSQADFQTAQDAYVKQAGVEKTATEAKTAAATQAADPGAQYAGTTAADYFKKLGHGAQTGADYDPLVQEASTLYGGMANTPGGHHGSNTGFRYAIMHGATPQQAAQTAWSYAQAHGGDYNNNVLGHNQGEESGYGWGGNPNDQIGLNYGEPNGGVPIGTPTAAPPTKKAPVGPVGGSPPVRR